MSEPENKSEMTDAPVSDAASTESPSSPEASRRKQASARRRAVVWGLIVVLVGAAVGATVGWTSQEPIYRSEGVVLVQPSLRSIEDPTGSQMMPMFDAFISFQVELMQQRRTTLMALETEAWRESGEPSGALAAGRFEERREIEHQRGTQHIVVRFHDVRPETAAAGVNALLTAYLDLAAELNSAEDQDLLEACRKRIDHLAASMEIASRKILDMTKDYGGVEGVEMRHRAVVEQLIEIEKALRALRGQAEAPKQPADATPGEIAVENPQMAAYLLEHASLQAEEEILAGRLGEEDERLLALRLRIRVLTKRIDEFAADWNRARAGRHDGESARDLGTRIRELETRLAALSMRARQLGQVLEDVARIKASREKELQQLEQLKAVRNKLEVRLSGTGRVVLASRGSLPDEPSRDDRTLYAWIGGLVGGLGALFLVLLFAFAARRLGHAADANAYHAKVRAAVELLPKRIGEWRAHDVGMPPGAAKLPRPNVAMGREFQNPSTGEHATLRIVQCKDARDLAAYYPPIQYPAEGWTLREAEPRHLPALLAAIPGTVYRFTRDSADGSSEVLVYNFFARPDGSIESGPAGALNETAQTHTQALGAAQFQILLGPTMTRDRRDEVFRTLIAAALPVMDALCVEDEA